MDDAREQGREWQSGWPATVAGLLGAAAAQVHFATIGVLIKPMSQELGWATSTITAGILICSIVAVPGTPAAGILAQRSGLRPILLPGLSAFLLCFAALGPLSHTRAEWIGGWILLALAGTFTKPNLWMLWVAQRFDRARGLAFAVIMSGAGVLAIFMPIITQLVVERFGWRSVFPLLAAAMAMLSIPALIAGLRFCPPGQGERWRAGQARSSRTGGLRMGDAARIPAFWQLGLISFLIGASLISLQVHMVPLLRSNGLDARAAALVAGAFGGSALLGRLAGGALLDVRPARLIGTASLLLPALGCLVFVAMPVTSATAVAMALLMGLGVGAEGDVLGYVTSRLFGVGNFGTVYGAISGFFALGAGVGPFAMSVLLDHAGSYALVMPTILAMLLVCVALFLSLKQRPLDSQPRADDPGDARLERRARLFPAKR